MLDEVFDSECRDWLAEEFEALTTEVTRLAVSEWAEEKRYLPKHTTPRPGFFRFSVCPYLEEIVDCFSLDSPVREVDLMKGAQVCATVGVIENVIGYSIDQVKSAPMMFLTADAELAQGRLDLNIMPMIRASNLSDNIQAIDEENTRKTGVKAKRIEWQGGGYLLGYGAKNADKLRMQSIQYMLEDEVDAFPETVGEDGDPQKLAEARVKAYWETRKIYRGSTPLVLGRSRIDNGFNKGDKRFYFVECKSCRTPQVLKFSGKDKETGHEYGLKWSLLPNGELDHDSVRYICQNPECGFEHINEDKTFLLAKENGAKWVATAEAKTPNCRSYHISALYSPVGFYPWSAIVEDWLEAWDVENGRARDIGKLQEFYNNNLGEPFELLGDKLSFSNVHPHRRQSYTFKQVPNNYVAEVAHSKILLLTCFVDVQKDYLSVGVFGWSKFSTAWVIEYFEIEGETDDLHGMFSPWVKLSEFLLNAKYESDDGFSYELAFTLIDSGYRTDTVYSFCEAMGVGFYPSKGQRKSVRGARFKEFSQMETATGAQGYIVTVDIYKERWYSALKRTWSNVGTMPKGHFNCPADVSDAQLRELTVETKRLVQDALTNKVIGTEWHRPQHSKNELWDLLIGNNAALDILAADIWIDQLKQEKMNWSDFYDYIEDRQLYFRPVQDQAANSDKA